MDLVEFWEREVLPQLRVETIYEGIAWKTRGPRFWRGPCPLHGGSDANFSVDSHTLRWRCFSQCGGGSLFAFLNGGVEPRGERWVATLRELARYTGVTFPDRELAPEVAARLEEITRQQALLEAFANLCQSALLDLPNAAVQPTRDLFVETRIRPKQLARTAVWLGAATRDRSKGTARARIRRG